MKFFIKLSATLLLLIASLSALAYFFWYKPKFSGNAIKASFTVNKDETGKNTLARLKQKAEDILNYASEHNCNSQYC